jgi:hypothetical protein
MEAQPIDLDDVRMVQPRHHLGLGRPPPRRQAGEGIPFRIGP